ncbi:FtsK/SpoIIIE domain-containing protein [Mycolicibacterium neoaurum]|uniref:FtsK/SpoIIIE domain-containing protein n=1 Tax=Mycolicibacterium neoaurum TaxID=1795 RepID=UPI001F4D2CE4|nr:FtsK/SpoIIIE domain-containing protein [Mycolicibacterium neoaurum]
MTEHNFHKKRARELQARTGMSYTRALRLVKEGLDGAGQATGLYEPIPSQPLTPALLHEARPAGADSTTLRPLPFGVDADGAIQALNLTSIHEGGEGPHAMIVGQGGAGKTMLLRTLVTGLCVQHSVDQLRVIYLRELSSDDFTAFPHVSLTDFGEAQDVLDGLREGATTAPHTVLIVDGFEYMMELHPDTRAQLEMLVRTGRARGIHVILADQQLRLSLSEPLLVNVRLRLALRMATEQSSRDFVGVPAAAHLPVCAGLGYYQREPGSDLVVAFRGLTTPPQRGVPAFGDTAER